MPLQPFTRRRFLGAAAGLSAAGLYGGLNPLLASQRRPVSGKGKSSRPALKITDIERHPILLPYHDYNAKILYRYHGVEVQARTVFIIKTNVGLEGYGEAPGRNWPKPEEIEKYIGTNPFDWIGEELNLPISMALYDLMGKYLDLPVWKLIGPKVRSRIPVAAWTVAQPPEDMVAEVKSVSRRGYHWLKFHVDEIQNVVDQTAAMQKVAPKGFKLHYDFNANSNLESVLPVLRELERFPIAGRIEDPISPKDRDGYRLLREKLKLTILIHHGPIDFMLEHLCDGLMAGHAAIGSAAKTAAVAESTNTPFMLQQIGGTINQACLAHEAAVFKMATIDHVNVSHLWKDDVTNETMLVVGGSVRVPEGPGLGVTLNREKLERYKFKQPPKHGPLLLRIRYADGLTIYLRHDPEKKGGSNNFRFIEKLDIPGPQSGYANPVVSDFWDETASAEFQRIWKQAESKPVVERGQ